MGCFDEDSLLVGGAVGTNFLERHMAASTSNLKNTHTFSPDISISRNLSSGV